MQKERSAKTDEKKKEDRLKDAQRKHDVRSRKTEEKKEDQLKHAQRKRDKQRRKTEEEKKEDRAKKHSNAKAKKCKNR